MSEIANRISDLIRKNGGQKAVSLVSGIPVRTLSNYSCGISEPKLSNLKSLAEVCGVSFLWLATGAVEEAVQSNDLLNRLRYALNRIEEFETVLNIDYEKTERIKSGIENPSAKELAEIAKCAKISLDWLKTGQAQPRPYNQCEEPISVAGIKGGVKYVAEQSAIPEYNTFGKKKLFLDCVKRLKQADVSEDKFYEILFLIYDRAQKDGYVDEMFALSLIELSQN